MFAFLVNASLRSRALVLAATVVVLVYGGSLLPQMRIDVLPDLNKGIVTVLTEAPGLSPEEVEVVISYRIEMAVNGASGVTRVRSVSSTGLSVVYVEFEWDSDVYQNRQIVAERLSQIQTELPPGVQPILGPISSLMGEILLIGISGDKVDPMVLREIADWVVAPRLKAMPGVSRVVPIGGLVRQFRVTPDVVRMGQLGITLDTLEAALAQFGTNTGGGVVNQSDQEFLIRNVSRTLDLEDLRNLVVELRDGQPILLRQFADVGFEPKQRRGDAGIMGSPGVIISVQKQPTVDTVVLTSQIEAVLADLQATMPEGVRVDEILFRASRFHQHIGRQHEAGAGGGDRHRGGHPLLVPLERPDDADLADRDPGLHPHNLHRIPMDGIHDQYDDARRAGDRHRRAGRRCSGRCREHLPKAETEPEGGASPAGAPRHRRGLTGDPVGHSLLDADHRAGLRAVVRDPRDRGTAVRAARHRIHRFDPGQPSHLDHPDARAVFLSAAAAAGRA